MAAEALLTNRSMTATPAYPLMALLKEVSRSFYLTLRVLPGSIRPQIGLAYLLARTTDTIADTELVPPGQRLEALQALRERILDLGGAALDFGALARCQAAAAERILLERCEASLGLLEGLAPPDRFLVRRVLDTITSGQELDLRRFAGASKEHVLSLRTEGELDDYTYRVAGCVGEFWTRMCRAHLFPKAAMDDEWLLANGVRFGKGLQLVNILRDLPADLRQGRCYLPSEALAALGLSPSDLLEPANEGRARPLYDHYLRQAEAHLAAGWDYTNALPRWSARVCLGCAWPILIGIETLALLRAAPVLDPGRRVKVGRAGVKRLIWRSVLYYPWPSAWRKLGERTTGAGTESRAAGEEGRPARSS
jgi:farnesyl-diphosphate farnesyltransferase